MKSKISSSKSTREDGFIKHVRILTRLINLFFSLCTDLRRRDDITTFFGFLVDTWGTVVQYHNQLSTLNINSMCDIMSASGEDDITAVK